MNKKEWLVETEDYFAGGFTFVDEDAPDGAWFQMHVDIAENLLDEIYDSIDIHPHQNIDEYDIVNHYLQNYKQ